MFCTNCGTEVSDGAKFCSVCGADLLAQKQAEGVAAEAKVNQVQETAADAGSAAQSETGTETVSAENAVQTAQATAVGAGSEAEAVTGETPENAAEAVVESGADGVQAVSGTMDNLAQAAAAAGVAASGNTVSEGSQAVGNVTAQYAKRIEEQKAAYTGTYSGAAASQNSQYDTQKGQFDGQSTQQSRNGSQSTQQGQFNGQTAQFNSQNGQYTQGNNGYTGTSYSNPQYAPAPKSGIMTAGMVLCVIALILSFFQVFYVIGGFFWIFGGMGEEGFFGFIFGILSFLIHVIKLCGLLGSALVMYLIWKKWDDSKAQPLMMGALTGGAIVILTVIARAVFTGIFNGLIFGYSYSSMFSGAFLSVVFSIAMMVITYVLINEKQINPFAGLQSSSIGDVLKNDLKTVADMAVEAKNEFQAGNSSTAYTSNQGSYGNANQNAPYTNGNPVNGQSQPNNFGGGILSTDRSIVAYVLLGLVTCGIYDLYMLHCIVQDVNITCAGDGKKTSGILEYILFGVLTCGIYDYIWMYNLGNRLQNNAPRYGMNFQEGGTAILLWWIFGACLCGVGPFVAAHIIIKNSNALNAAYNNMNMQQNGNA